MDGHCTFPRSVNQGFLKYNTEQTTDYSTHSSNKSGSRSERSGSRSYSRGSEGNGTLQRVTPSYVNHQPSKHINTYNVHYRPALQNLQYHPVPAVHQHTAMGLQHGTHGQGQYRPSSPFGTTSSESTYRQTTAPHGGQPHGNQSTWKPVYQSTRTVTSQPQPGSNGDTDINDNDGMPHPWNTGLCQCCDGTTTCCAICCCLPCFECWLADKLGEGCCLPICVPLAAMAMRIKVRLNNNIQGSILGDFCASMFCRPCVLCQMKRELDFIESRDNETSPRQSNHQRQHTGVPGPVQTSQPITMSNIV